VDPNDKTGPVGFGEAHFVRLEDATLPYRIDFENDATATAPAQVVSISDQLDSDLDWSTFELTEVAFADQFIGVPPGLQHFEKAMPMEVNGTSIEVHVEVGLRAATGEVYAWFYTMDPATRLPPDVLTGFLLPEDGTGRGQGHISYLVRPKADLPTGTEIRNVAQIQFDFGEIIATNQVDPHDPSKGTDPAKECLNTIDAGAPASRVEPLPDPSTSASFVVAWTGEDDAGGSGIATYDVYVSTDGGEFVLWKEAIGGNSATYAGAPGHAYAFYSVATDNVGNRESLPSVPDAVTSVPPADFGDAPVGSGLSYPTLLATDGAGHSATGPWLQPARRGAGRAADQLGRWG